MVHKPEHKVHSFRGLLGHGGQDEINLERSNVNLAYRIVKFRTMDTAPGDNNIESVCKIYRESQTSINGAVNFSDPDLLGVVYFTNNTSPNIIGQLSTIIFDQTLFSRNIYVTNNDATGGSLSINYYIELEEVPVTASTLMQLKLQVARKLNPQQD